MTVEFRPGVPEGCTEWSNTHVGRGNRTGPVDNYDRAWFYRRERVYPPGPEVFEGFNLAPKYVPTRTVKDPKLAAGFALRWSS